MKKGYIVIYCLGLLCFLSLLILLIIDVSIIFSISLSDFGSLFSGLGTLVLSVTSVFALFIWKKQQRDILHQNVIHMLRTSSSTWHTKISRLASELNELRNRINTQPKTRRIHEILKISSFQETLNEIQKMREEENSSYKSFEHSFEQYNFYISSDRDNEYYCKIRSIHSDLEQACKYLLENPVTTHCIQQLDKLFDQKRYPTEEYNMHPYYLLRIKPAANYFDKKSGPLDL